MIRRRVESTGDFFGGPWDVTELTREEHAVGFDAFAHVAASELLLRKLFVHLLRVSHDGGGKVENAARSRINVLVVVEERSIFVIHGAVKRDLRHSSSAGRCTGPDRDDLSGAPLFREEFRVGTSGPTPSGIRTGFRFFSCVSLKVKRCSNGARRSLRTSRDPLRGVVEDKLFNHAAGRARREVAKGLDLRFHW